MYHSKLVSTRRTGTHPEKNLYQQAVSREFFHSWVGGLPGVCLRGVLELSWKDAKRWQIKVDLPAVIHVWYNIIYRKQIWQIKVLFLRCLYCFSVNPDTN